jgi:hypothetical protein
VRSPEPTSDDFLRAFADAAAKARLFTLEKLKWARCWFA